jgi:hypothetical protein
MSTFQTQRWLLNRRHFLRGTGAAIALPFLNAMVPLRAAAAPLSKRPRRSVFVYIPNGVNIYTWRMEKAGRDYTLSQPLKSLEKHRDCITPISGLYHPNAAGTHHGCGDSWLTGTGMGVSNFRNTASCDQLMAEVTAPLTRFTSLELSLSSGVGKPGLADTLSFSRDGVPMPAEDSPSTVFERLFGEEKGSATERESRRRSRRSVLDAIGEDARALDRKLGHDDRSKLAEYLQSVREVEIRTERMEAWLKVPKPKVDGTRFQRTVSKVAAGDYYRTMYDLMVLALRTDMTRVITYMTANESLGLAIPEIGITQGRHELSHHNGDKAVLESLARSDAFLVEQFSYFLDQLKAADDGGESLLDRTMVLFGSGMSYGHSHSLANLPTIFAGGAKLGLRHGQHLDYNLAQQQKYKDGEFHEFFTPVDPKAHFSNLLLTMLQKMEVNAEQFVDSLGPISELTS